MLGTFLTDPTVSLGTRHIDNYNDKVMVQIQNYVHGLGGLRGKGLKSILRWFLKASGVSIEV